MHDTRVLAIPGANIDTIFNMIESNKVGVQGYRIILLHFGSNDAFLAEPIRVAQNMSRLVDLIIWHNPQVRIAVSGIIVRYEHTLKEEKSRRESNDEIAIMCRLRGIRHMKSWTCVLDKGVPIHADYARDDIHLSRSGADKIKDYMEGTIISMKGQ
jgi:lysophospholipase L1-like esterase